MPIIMGVGVPLAGCNAQSIPSTWLSDCVGRMRISLPEVADVAAVTPEAVIESDTSGNLPSSYFSDGKGAPYSSIGYFGPVEATAPLTDKQISSLRARLVEEAAYIAQQQKAKRKLGASTSVAVLPTPGWDGVVWDFGTRIRGRLFVGGQYYAWSISVKPEERNYLDINFKALMAGLTPRKNFTLPIDRGVCMPYFFVSDSGVVDRLITTTYRLRSHPDVTVILQDASATGILAFQNPDKFTAKSKTNFFWTQRYQTAISRRSLSNDTISFAGQRGLETRLKLGHENGSEDYGYSVFTRGDPKAKQDTPDLMLVLIRNAADAKAKGRNPISEDAFFALAQSVAASVKARPAVKQID